ncbi:hypothetical protein SAMN05421771_3471 [Granulicella pectinivorans]|uniref:Lipoprotein n=1 Tax=Granulicella pectinivorans TaxID=474950 RepID=A0A1I6MRZ9_9BACT|nr:hypothetical protein [Granulicella pectinivorans]SFS18456.1 hypothetical protein SAMN05421771_3471 [Granulicella pectinivorans]
MHLRYAVISTFLAVVLLGCKAKGATEQPVMEETATTTSPVASSETQKAATTAVSDAVDPAQDGSLDARTDVCDFKGIEKPSTTFKNYNQDKYDNNDYLGMKGKALFFDDMSKFRCGSVKLAMGTGKGTYSTDNILLVTDPGETRFRMVRISMGMTPHLDELAKAYEEEQGSGKVLKSTVQTKGDLKRGEEIRLIETMAHSIYIDSVYMGASRVGAILILMRDDAEGNRNVMADLMGTKK